MPEATHPKIDTNSTTLEYILNKFNLSFDDKTRLPIEIPNVGRDNLPGLFNELGYKTGAEIGVLDGEFSEQLCQANSKLKLYGVDPWEQIGDFHDYDQGRLDRAYATTKQRLSKYSCEIIKKTSMDAIKDFENGSLDFVYLDADHSFQNVVNDVCEWIKKVKLGGIISGHDFRRYSDERGRYHVPEAISGYTVAYHIRPWFVLGRKKAVEGEIRDKDRSWMWVKLQ